MPPDPAADAQARQHLTTLLLAEALHVSYALDQLRTFAARNTGDPAATADFTAAITTLTRVRAQLIDAADRLNQSPPHP